MLPECGQFFALLCDFLIVHGLAFLAERLGKVLVSLCTNVVGKRKVLALPHVPARVFHLPEPVSEVEHIEECSTAESGTCPVCWTVGDVGEGLDVDKPEKEHPKALENGVDADLDVFGAKVLRILDDAKGDKEAEERVLPESDKHNRLDRKELEDGLVRVDEGLDGEVELDETVHGPRDGDGDEQRTPYMPEPGHPACEAVDAKVLHSYRSKRTHGAYNGVLENADLHDPEEMHSLRLPLPGSEWPHPLVELEVPEDSMLLCARVTGVGEKEVEEGRDEDSLVAVANGLVVECVLVEEKAHERHNGVDGYHDEEADNVSLLRGERVVGEVFPDEPDARDSGYNGEGAADDPADIMRLKVELAVVVEGDGVLWPFRMGRTRHVHHDGLDGPHYQ